MDQPDATKPATKYGIFFVKTIKRKDLPPMSDSLSHHIKRANFKSHVLHKSLVAIHEESAIP
jgi:hypothetical protein